MEIWEEFEQMVKAEEKAKKVGIAKAEITKVEEGKRKDFYSEETLQKLKEKYPRLSEDDEIIRIHFKTDFGLEAFQDFTKSKHRKSNLFKFYVQYGKPKTGKEITVKFDKAKQIWKIVF